MRELTGTSLRCGMTAEVPHFLVLTDRNCSAQWDERGLPQPSIWESNRCRNYTGSRPQRPGVGRVQPLPAKP